jgi:hyaluronan synthase
MNEDPVKFPREIEDRRRRARSRREYQDRRRELRYQAQFPVTIYVGSGKDERIYQGMARDISDGGFLLENVDIPEGETRIRLKFKIPDGTMPEEFLHGEVRLDGTVKSKRPERKAVGVAFENKLSEKLSRSSWLVLRWAAVIGLLLTLVFIIFIRLENIYFFWFDVPIFLYSLLVGCYLISRFVFAALYRPPRPSDLTPSVTIVVPAYNEGPMIQETLKYAFEVAYPEDKLQVIAVNDGSQDDTLTFLKQSKERYPELVILDYQKNQGKRKALAAGAELATGEIVVFIDSDSLLQPSSLKLIMDGFTDPKVAAVCGHCEVANAWANFLTRMQAVRYFIGFRILKAAESIFSAITCLSGPFSAYRNEVIHPLLKPWVNQTFMGVPATFGDDRSLTNLILKRKHKVIYDERAKCSTVVPEKYGQFFRQQMRWKRSWFRESLLASFFIWRRQPLMSISFYLGVLLPLLCPVVVFRALVYVPLFHHGTPFKYIIGVFLMSTLMSSIYLFIKRSRLWIYGTPFCFFYMFILIWQLPWAMLTFWKSHWGTRG